MKAFELYSAGKLTEALAAATEAVKAKPTDVDARAFLAELACLAGELDRADAQLDALSKTSQKPLPGLLLMRQLIRAEQARQQFQSEGRLPELLGPPTPSVELALRASIAIREGKLADANALLEEAESKRTARLGKLDGKPFFDLRDLDDLTAGVLEVLTSTGKYYWVPLERVASCELDPPKRPLDLLWRPASLSVRGGPDGRVFVAAIYANHGTPSDDLARLGRRTDWIGAEGEPVRGVGLRMLAVDDDARTILEIQSLEIDAAT